MVKGDGGKDSEREVRIILSPYYARLCSPRMLYLAHLGKPIQIDISRPKNGSEESVSHSRECFLCHGVGKCETYRPSHTTKMFYYLPKDWAQRLKEDLAREEEKDGEKEEEKEDEKKDKKSRLKSLKHKLSLASFFSKATSSENLASSSTETIVPAHTQRSLGSSAGTRERVSRSRNQALSTIDHLIIANRTPGSGSDNSSSQKRTSLKIPNILKPLLKSPRRRL